MAGRGRLGRVDDFGAAGLRDQIGQIMLRQGGALPLAVVRGCFDVAAVNGDTREVHVRLRTNPLVPCGVRVRP